MDEIALVCPAGFDVRSELDVAYEVKEVWGWANRVEVYWCSKNSGIADGSAVLVEKEMCCEMAIDHRSSTFTVHRREADLE